MAFGISRNSPIVALFLLTWLCGCLLEPSDLGSSDAGYRLQASHSLWTGAPQIRPGDPDRTFPIGSDGQRQIPWDIGQSLVMLPADIVVSTIFSPLCLSKRVESKVREAGVGYLTFPVISATVVAVAVLLLGRIGFSCGQSLAGGLTLFFCTSLFPYTQIHQENSCLLLFDLLALYGVTSWFVTRANSYLMIAGAALGISILTRLPSVFDLAAVTAFELLIGLIGTKDRRGALNEFSVSFGKYAPVLRRRQGPMMSGFLTFMDRYRDEAACIAALASALAQRVHLRRVRQAAGLSTGGSTAGFECADCGRQHSVTASTVLHRTRTPLRKWFAAAWLIGQDKRGVSALFLARELALRYETAWLMTHKLRHGLSERPEYPLDGLIEIDESYYGGRGKPESRGRGLTDPNKSLMAIAVETVLASPRQGEGIKKSHFVAGSARIAVLPAATVADLGGFVRGAAKPGTRIITDGLKSYDGLGDSFRHYSIVQEAAKTPMPCCPSSMSCSAT